MTSRLNRALQVRAADRLRTVLARDDLSGLPSFGALTVDDQRELSDVGAGRLAAVAVRIETPCALGEITRLLGEHVRRTDLLGCFDPETLVVLAPGLDPLGGRCLDARLSELLAQRQVELDGESVEIVVRVGVAYRSPASRVGWSVRELVQEAALNARGPVAALI